MQYLKTGLVQMDIVWEDVPANLIKLDKLLEDASGLDLIILPEMFNTGFSMAPERIAENEDGPTVAWMCTVSGRLETVIMGSVAIEENGKYYNRCFVVDNGSIIARYDKHNLFTGAGEEKVFGRGNENVTFDLKGWKIKPLICYDLRFPAWCYNKEEADLIVFVANWPAPRVLHWSTLLRARAIENQAFVIGVNRVGIDGTGKAHSGYSAVISPMGKVMAEQADTEALILSEINKQEITEFRSMFNVLHDKRVSEL